MDLIHPEAKNYLAELYQMTSGDLSAQVSMYDVGAALNLERNTAGKIAEDLIGDGLVEVKTLSGGIGITAQGIEQVQASGLAVEEGSPALELGRNPVLEADGKEAVATLLEKIKTALSSENTDYGILEEMVIDIKTIEVQLLSARPKTAIVREVLRALAQSLRSTTASNLSDTIEKIIAE